MKRFIDGLKAQDLIACKRAFHDVMQVKVDALVAQKQQEIINSIKADGEVPIEPEEDL